MKKSLLYSRLRRPNHPGDERQAPIETTAIAPENQWANELAIAAPAHGCLLGGPRKPPLDWRRPLYGCNVTMSKSFQRSRAACQFGSDARATGCIPRPVVTVRQLGNNGPGGPKSLE
jgi:hypothetical protein